MREKDLLRMIKRYCLKHYIGDSKNYFDIVIKQSRKEDNWQSIRYNSTRHPIAEFEECGNDYKLYDFSEIDKEVEELIMKFLNQDWSQRDIPTKYNVIMGINTTNSLYCYSAYKKCESGYQVAMCSKDELKKPELQFTEDELDALKDSVNATGLCEKLKYGQIDLGLKEVESNGN